MALVSDPGRIAAVTVPNATAYKVELRDNKPLVILDDNHFSAVEKYKFACGIIATDNQFKVTPVTDETELAKAVDLPLRGGPPLVGFVPADTRKETWLGSLGV